MAVKTPRYRETGKYIKWTDLEKGVRRRDVEAFRTVRRAFYSDDEWGQTSLDEKQGFAKTVSSVLSRFGSISLQDPSYRTLVKMREALAKKGYETVEALKFANLLVRRAAVKRAGKVKVGTRSVREIATKEYEAGPGSPQPGPQPTPSQPTPPAQQGPVPVPQIQQPGPGPQPTPSQPTPPAQQGPGPGQPPTQQQGGQQTGTQQPDQEEGEREIHWKERYSVWSVMDYLPVLLLAVAGFVLSYTFTSYLFMFGFLSWIIVYIIPPPGEFNAPDIQAGFRKYGHGQAGWRQAGRFANPFLMAGPAMGGMFGRRRGRHYLRSGWTRSFFKGLAIVLLALAFKNSQFPLANLAALLVVFFGYYNLGVVYDREEPSEYIESLTRFILGFLIIPFFILLPIFESFVLSVIGLAFLGIPPILRGDDPTEKSMEAMPLKLWFAFLMLVALIGSGVLIGSALFGWAYGEGGFFLDAFPTWGLGNLNALGPLFLYFWIITAIAGFFSPAETRPYTGFLMIGAAIFIFALGPGTQIVGSAFLGEWFPTIYQGVSAVTQPLADVLGSFGSTFRNAFLLVSCPTCYAQSILNGSFSQDPETGLAGAFGVEITDSDLTPVFVGQPYSALVKVQNKGAYIARDVWVGIRLGDKPPDGASMGVLGFRGNGTGMTCSPQDCYQWVDGAVPNSLAKLDLRQALFPSEGLTCREVSQLGLRSQFLPLKAEVEYNYQIDSSLSLEFISAQEWDRLAAAGTLEPQVKKAATLRNAPVRLNIDTLEQPIREGTPHFVGVNLVSAKKTGTLREGSITVVFPDKLGFPSCSPRQTTEEESGGVNTLLWDEATLGESYLIYCNLQGFSFSGLSGPSQTFVIRANASYRYREVKSFTPGKIEFGGIRCCTSNADCVAGQVCNTDTGTCIATPDLGEACTDRCREGVAYPFDSANATRLSSLACKTLQGGQKACCQQDISPDLCQTAFDLRQLGKSTNEILQGQGLPPV